MARMSHKIVRGLVLSAALVAAPVLAGYKLKSANVPVAVAKSGLMVTSPIAWNRNSARIGRFAETWTLDGVSLNDLTFYGGIADNTTLFREVNKKVTPLPRFSATMLIPDIVQMFEASYRVALSTSLMTIDSVEPMNFAGAEGFRFTYNFTVQGEDVKRKGEARGAIIGGKLYLITFEAPAIYYFDRDVEEFRKVADSAKLAVVKKK